MTDGEMEINFKSLTNELPNDLWRTASILESFAIT